MPTTGAGSGSGEKLAAIHARLTSAVADLARSDAWAAMLRVAARFPTYSPSNVLLITVQRPAATRVAGLRTWNALGRRVRQGEKGIAILAPCLSTRPSATTGASEVTPATDQTQDADAARVVRGFRVVHVFDLTQTEGAPLPTVAPVQLRGAAPQRLWEELVGLLARDGYRLERGDCAGANGWTSFPDRRVRVRDDVDPAQACKTLTHEIAHIRAGHDTRFATAYHASIHCRGIAEVEAESVAFVVTTATGLDSTAYTVPYVTGWAHGEVDLLKATATRVLTVAGGILTSLDEAATPTAPSPLQADPSRTRQHLSTAPVPGVPPGIT